MGAKKKGMANKLAKMSDDERARYLQHRADMEEEVRRRKEQLISTFLKNKLKKEDGFTRLNIAKINQYWHQILRKLKCKDLKNDVEHLKRYFERVFDLKNNNINKLLLELQQAEDQYSNNFQSHLTHIDKIIDFHTRNIKEIHLNYEEDRFELLAIINNERKEYSINSDEEMKQLQIINHGQEMVSKTILRTNYDLYMSKTDNVIRENKLQFDEMRQSKEAALGELWRQVSSVLREYVLETDKKRAHLAELHALDAESASEIEINQENIDKQENEINKLNHEYEEAMKNHKTYITELKQNMELATKMHLKTKLRLHKDLKLDDKRIRHLTDKSKKSLFYLKTWADKGNKILVLARACRRFESPKEQLLKWRLNDPIICEESVDDSSDNYDASNEENVFVSETRADKKKVLRPKSSFPRRKTSAKSHDFVSVVSTSSATSSLSQSSAGVLLPASTIIEDTCDSLKDVEGLWDVYNKVVLDCFELKREKKDLEEENRKLMACIRGVLLEAAMKRMDVKETRVVSGVGVKRCIKSAPPPKFLC